MLKVLVAYRLIDPGSEWRLHRQWFDASAMADLLESDFALAEKNTLYRCLDRVREHKEALLGFLVDRRRRSQRGTNTPVFWDSQQGPSAGVSRPDDLRPQQFGLASGQRESGRTTARGIGGRLAPAAQPMLMMQVRLRRFGARRNETAASRGAA